jgi:hypothetical protein
MFPGSARWKRELAMRPKSTLPEIGLKHASLSVEMLRCRNLPVSLGAGVDTIREQVFN